jgi:hypothetical protein
MVPRAANVPIPSRPVRTPRRIAAALGALSLAALLLAACSGSGGSLAVDEGRDSGSVSGADAEQAAISEETRDVVIEGTMTVAVADVAESSNDAAQIVKSAGGRIDGREEWNDGETGATVMILRIPASELDGVLDELRTLGEVRTLQTSSTDVTAAVQDIDARVVSLTSTIARLTAFQDRSASVSDLLSIEKEIAERQAELEGYLASQADFAERIEYSTITLTVQGVAGPVASAPDSFVGGLAVGWDAFAGFISGLVIVVGVLLPWLVAAGVIAVGIVLLVKWLGRRRARRVADAPILPDPPPGGHAPQPTQPIGAGAPPAS